MELGKRFVPTFPKENTVCIRDTSNKSRERLLNFEFDKVFDHHTSQQTIFSEAAPLAISVMDGYNAAILAYGQTGSGKVSN
jgi:kinesin family protein C2/C3